MLQVLDISDTDFIITVLTGFKDKRNHQFQKKKMYCKHLKNSRFEKELNRYFKTELKMNLAADLNTVVQRGLLDWDFRLGGNIQKETQR